MRHLVLAVNSLPGAVWGWARLAWQACSQRKRLLLIPKRGAGQDDPFSRQGETRRSHFSAGAPSQVDTWDPKPELTNSNGKSFPLRMG